MEKYVARDLTASPDFSHFGTQRGPECRGLRRLPYVIFRPVLSDSTLCYSVPETSLGERNEQHECETLWLLWALDWAYAVEVQRIQLNS